MQITPYERSQVAELAAVYNRAVAWVPHCYPTEPERMVAALDWGSRDDVKPDTGRCLVAVGERGIILHYNGVSWSMMSFRDDFTWGGVWGSSPNNIYIVGYEEISYNHYGKIYHYDGLTWSFMDTPIVLVQRELEYFKLFLVTTIPTLKGSSSGALRNQTACHPSLYSGCHPV